MGMLMAATIGHKREAKNESLRFALAGRCKGLNAPPGGTKMCTFEITAHRLSLLRTRSQLPPPALGSLIF